MDVFLCGNSSAAGGTGCLRSDGCRSAQPVPERVWDFRLNNNPRGVCAAEPWQQLAASLLCVCVRVRAQLLT